MELLEREKCLADLGAWLGAAAQHGGSIALVAGEAGIGKTALLREFCRRQHDRRVLWGACDSMLTPRPLAALHDIARQTRGELLAAITCGASRDAVLTAALDELDGDAGALVVLEDMHWADESTLDLLRFLGRRIHLTHALLVVTFRDDETGPRHPLRVALAELPRASTRAMSIPPLSESGVAHLAGLNGRAATGLHALTGGNPFLLTELLAAEPEAVPPGVRGAMLARVLRLSPAARELAEFVSIVPGSAEPWLIGGALRVDETDVEECLGVGMLRNDDGALAFRHELARRSLEAALSPARRRSLHERALAILASRPGLAAARLAHHAEAAANTEAILQFANRAELELESSQADSALDWSRRAVELAQSLGCPAALTHALSTLGTVRLAVGDHSGWGDLERSLEVAQRGAHREEITRAYSRLVAMTVTHRRYGDASRHLIEGLGYCREPGFDSVRLDLVTCRARLRFEQGDWNRASEDLEAVLGNPGTAPSTRAAALRILCHLRVRRGEPEPAAPLEPLPPLGVPTAQPLRIAALASIRAEAAFVAGDRESVVREAGPAYQLIRTHHARRLRGELAVLLWRVGALRAPSIDIEEPYALEIAGDWQAAACRWETLGCPYEYASVLALHGAEPEQRAALRMLDQMGAAPAARALRRRMREQAVRGVPRGSRPSTRRHPLGLTRRQAEILALLSEGLRNAAIAKRLFVSTKTVDHHVSAILAKLGVPTRTQAVARAYERATGLAAQSVRG